MAARKIMSLSAEQESKFGLYIDRWKQIGLSTALIDHDKHDRHVAAVYRLAKLDAPRMIYTPCPLSGALAASTYAAITSNSAVHSAMDSAMDSAVYSAVYSAVGSAVYSAVDSAVYSAVGSAVHSAVYSAMDSAVYSAVRSAVYSAVRSAVYSAVRSAVDSAVGSAVRSAVYSAVDSAVYSAVDSAVEAAVYSAVYPAVRSVQWQYYFWGNQWAGYAAWGEFFANECKVSVDRDCLGMMEHGHYIWPFKFVCFASERPVSIHVDDAGRSHRVKGPAVEYSTGWGPTCWHGVVVPPAWLSDSPPSASEALTQSNMEQRRAACEIVGWAKILHELNATTIDKHANRMVGELVEVDIPDVGRERFLRIMCGTGREFALPVPPMIKRATEAQAWLNWTTEDISQPTLRT